MNFGAFAGGFSDGFGSGVKMGKTLRDILKENKMQETLAASREEAAAAYDAQNQKASASVEEAPAQAGQPYKTEGGAVVSPVRPASIVSTGLAPLAASPTESPDAAGAATAASSQPPPSVSTQTPAAVPGSGASAEGNAGEAEAMAKPTPQQVAAAAPTPQQSVAAGGVQPGKFEAGGKQFDTRKQAESAAGVRNDPVARDLFITKQVSQKMQDYFMSTGDMEGAEKYAKYAKSKRGEAVNSAWAKVVTAPDLETATKHARDLYEYVDDGVTTTDHKIVTKADGTQVAVVTLKDKTTGKSSEMEMTQDKIMQLAGNANPQKMYEEYRAQQSAAEKMKAERSIKREDRAYTRETELLKQEGSEKREAARLQAQADRDDKRGEQRLNEIELKSKLDAENQRKYKATTDPIERRALIRSDAMKNDTKFPRMSLPEQNKYIDDAMESIHGKATKDEPAAKPSAGNVAIETKPMPYKEGAPVKYNKQDGKPYHLIDGKYIPIEGGVVPTAKPALPPTGAGAGRGAVVPPTATAAPTPATTAATGVPAPAPAPAAPAPQAAQPAKAAPAAVSRTDTLMRALNPGGNASLNEVLAPKASAIAGAADALQALEEKTRQAAASGNTAAVQQAAAEQQRARTALDQMLKQLEPGMQKTVLAALAR